MDQPSKFNRRDFLKSTAAFSAFTIVPSYVLGGKGNAVPSEKLNIAAIGLNRVSLAIDAAQNDNLVAFCDVDDNMKPELADEFPKARRYRDYRVMLEKEGDNIDAVVIATPDHTHAVIGMACMQLGKHVYLEKPMSRLLWENRELEKASKRYDVVTQMGNQGRSMEGCRLLKEWVDAGAIGNVKEVHCWTDRPWWPQGVSRPQGQSVPANLDWDLWLGPAPFRPYNSTYHPFHWRGRWDFGTGSLGDMGCHILDAPYFALQLNNPVSVHGSFTREMNYKDTKDETFPKASKLHYKFASNADRGEIDLHWYDGGIMPKRPEIFEPQRNFPSNGTLLIGDKGMLMSNGQFGGGLRLVPETAMRGFTPPQATIERIDVSHTQNWTKACKGIGTASSNFEYAAGLNEIVLLGNLAIKAEGRPVEWDSENLTVTNIPALNEYVKEPYREGWSL